MSDSRRYKVRDLGTEAKDPFRIYLNLTSLAHHKLTPGSACLLTTTENQSFMATAWNPTKQLDESVVHVSRAFLEMHNLQMRDRVKIEKLDTDIPSALSITIYEVSDDSEQDLVKGGSNDHVLLETIRARIQKHAAVAVGMTFLGASGVLSGRTFKISKVQPLLPYRAIYKVSSETVIELTTEAAASKPSPCLLRLNDTNIGGLGTQVEHLRDLLIDYSDDRKLWDFGSNPPNPLEGGILLYGRRGTGKSLLLESIEASGWQQVFHVQQQSFSDLKVTVDMALKLEPSLIIFDWLESMLTSRHLDMLIEAFKKTEDARVLLVGSTSKVRDLPESIRDQGRFQYQINTPVPDSKARAEILKLLGGKPKDHSDALLDELASRTHGYVGGDLKRLRLEAYRKRRKRIMLGLSESSLHERYDMLAAQGEIPAEKKLHFEPELVDWEAALMTIRPSTMDDFFIETPQTRWSDIGGYHAIKKELRFAIDLQTRYASEWTALGVEPTKGFLLYGPPGCSKTMIARAVATEMSLNFLAVKGAEVLDKYVGETERKLREIFDTARAASPSVIFFDEIDAIGSSRPSGGGGSAGAMESNLHTVTTLLNEMDGIGGRKEVFVLAATNRPHVLDPALMRPGRLNRHIYVGLPDADARLEILEGKLARVKFPLEVDMAWLAEATEGYSGAEVIEVVTETLNLVMQEHIEHGSPIVLERRCFEYALQKVKRSVSAEDVEVYQAWGKRSGK